MVRVIKYPEMTKKISTPTNPPPLISGKMVKWKAITGSTAKVRRPSISSLCIPKTPTGSILRGAVLGGLDATRVEEPMIHHWESVRSSIGTTQLSKMTRRRPAPCDWASPNLWQTAPGLGRCLCSSLIAPSSGGDQITCRTFELPFSHRPLPLDCSLSSSNVSESIR